LDLAVTNQGRNGEAGMRWRLPANKVARDIVPHDMKVEQ